MDESTQAIGLAVGIDVNAMYEKYSKQTNNSADSTFSYKLNNSSTEEFHVDDIVACKRCHGSGLMRITYNHQVRDVNCEDCEAQGLLMNKNAKKDSHSK